ncbi:MAG: DNA methyltransferase [candidate division WOR-3 bacterium]
MKQIELFKTKRENNRFMEELNFKRVRDEKFDFKDTLASYGIYGIHPYPAMFHFLVVRKLIKKFSKKNDWILDPFMGSGVVAGECLISGRNFVGYDINPLGVLISKVRTTPISCGILLEELQNILNIFKQKKPEDIEFHNIHYWFDEEVMKSLSKLRQVIFEIKDEKIKNFFKIVFSETVKRVSKAKFDEFKLIRKKEKNNNYDVLKIFSDISLKNIGLLSEFYKKFPPTKVILKLEERNILDGIPLKDNSIDLVITSPPYGDSRTTVAYGQFSKLPLRWLGIDKDIDKISLGAKPKEIYNGLPSDTFYKYIEKIASKDEKRAKEVFSFYFDLYNSIKIISKKVKKGGIVCFVVGNRRVKGVELPTDKISADFFEREGFEHEKTIIRAITHKRMPIENAPSNIKGEKSFTMRYEYIVILEKVKD